MFCFFNSVQELHILDRVYFSYVLRKSNLFLTNMTLPNHVFIAYNFDVSYIEILMV
ncbi:hypothetical protein IWQ47_002316 [Aquimarina sp. EL_43]|nr:hypothetical protein [Aquimarina sp. EL_35]MBG6151001.1 hypothetical protein [Aquimarina sp. EL_32]MBG6169242.1 hypothetical protein [Aquimarina sp. EL_43]